MKFLKIKIFFEGFFLFFILNFLSQTLFCMEDPDEFSYIGLEKFPLHLAIKNGKLDIVSPLIESGIGLNFVDEFGYTPLHYAVVNEDLNAIRLLLEKKDNLIIDAKTQKGETALYLAVQKGNLDIVKLLVDAGANIKEKDGNGFSPLKLAENLEYQEITEFLMKKHKKLLQKNFSWFDGFTLPVEILLKIIKFTLYDGFDLKAIIKLAHINTKFRDSIMYLLSRKFPEIYQQILHFLCGDLKENEIYELFFQVAKHGYHKIIQWFLDKGVNVNAISRTGYTPLHLSASNGQLEIVKLLLDRCANIEAKNKDDDTPLHFASKNGHLEVVKLLLDRDANIEAKDIWDYTSLHLAALKGDLKVVKLLLDKGANIEVKEKDNDTPLHWASKNGHLEVVKLLLDKGANIEARNKNDDTPLHFAAWDGHLKIVKLLLDKGANIEARNKLDDTPLHRAAENGHLKVVKLLLDRGANIEAKNKYGKIPFDVTRRQEIKDFLKTWKFNH